MNVVLETILSSECVSDGQRTYALTHPDFPQFTTHMDREEGAFLQELVAHVRPSQSLEIGFAYGVSTLYICEALAALGQPVRHIVADPFQSTKWHGIGLRNVREAGYASLVDFREERSEFLLPRLLQEGVELDFALIDGWHTFDQVMVEFYYLNRMLRVGGIIALDDANRRGVNRVIRHALTYPSYRVFQASKAEASPISLAGKVRRAVGKLPHASDVLRPDFVHRDWDLGIFGSCIAIQKTAEDNRSSGWDSWDRAF
jgi:predicted O-methyltransferase YrrM